jgi:two-component system CheB/CheR fusion protein
LGQNLEIIFTPEDRAVGICDREVETALAQDRASDERWHQRKDGTRFWVSGVLMAMKDPAGHPVGFVKILRDHTEARRAAEALVRSHAEAEAANRAKDHFLAVLSHELRTPLTPVLLVAADMAKNEKLPPGTRQAMGMVHRNVELEARLIDDLLDVTRIARGKTEINSAPIDLHEVIGSAIRICSADIQDKNQQLQVDLRAQRHQLSGDSHRLQQVFWNLLKNASKFTPAEGVIKITSWNEDHSILVSVTDTGIGIRQEMLPKIFNPFEQGDAGLTREFGGLGLGLAIAKATIDAHEGTLSAASDGPGKGATFTVKLPLTAL